MTTGGSKLTDSSSISTSNFTMEKKPVGANPGMIWCNSKVTKPDELSWDGFCIWYRDVHIPDVLKTGAVREAFRYEAVDPSNDRPHLTLYYAEDIEGLYDKVKGAFDDSAIRVCLLTATLDVPHHDESLPGSQDMFDFAFFDARFYKATTLYEPEHPKSSKVEKLCQNVPGQYTHIEQVFRT